MHCPFGLRHYNSSDSQELEMMLCAYEKFQRYCACDAYLAMDGHGKLPVLSSCHDCIMNRVVTDCSWIVQDISPLVFSTPTG